MALYDNAGRIPRKAANSSLLALFIVAVLSAACRFAIRLHYQRRLLWDDAFLLFAILLGCACIGLWVSFVDDMYFAESLLLGHFTPDMVESQMIPKVLRLHKLSDVALILTWTALHSVKLSFLIFFEALTPRTSKVRRYWWTVMIYTTFAWVVGLPLEIVSCPYWDERSMTCASGDKFPKTLAIAVIIFMLDISTDVLILFIPVIILHKISVSLRVKFTLGMSLCLSVATIIVTLVRVSGLKVPGLRTVDVVWEVYWQFVEVCIGITVVSATAFRTLFVQHAARSTAKKSTPRSYFGQRFRQKMQKRSAETDDDVGHGLPENFPGGTMTGMRTFIDHNGKTNNLDTMRSNSSMKSESKDHSHSAEQTWTSV